jgi:hypothetical protein
MAENPVTNCAAADKTAIDAFSKQESLDIIDIVRTVVKGKMEKADLEGRKRLIICPNMFLDGSDGFIMTIMMKKAEPLYNIIYRLGLVWAIAKVLPVATKHTAPMHIYLGLDKVKLLSLDPAFIEQLDPLSDEAIDRIVECFLPMSSKMANSTVNSNPTRKQRGGKRGKKTRRR